MKSQDETVALIRKHLSSATEEVVSFNSGSGVYSPLLRRAVVLLNAVSVDFERLIESLSAEAK